MKQKKIFITGTDTDVGKTLFTTALIHTLQNNKQTVTAIKPIAAGCEKTNGVLKNSDALSLQNAMTQKLPYSTINPVTLEHPIAPHIAAENENVKISVKNLQQQCNLKQHKTDYLLVEGAGGWLVPLNKTETFADFAIAESLEVILVVGMKLGCISHALLTIESIKASGLNLVGWVANAIDPNMSVLIENIETLKERISAPLIAQIPYITENEPDKLIQQACKYVNISPLLN